MTGRYAERILNLTSCNRAFDDFDRYALFLSVIMKKSTLFRPVNGNIKWSRIEALFVAVGCVVVEGSGSSVTFEKNGRRAYFHRSHPQKELLRYRVTDARHFLESIGVKL